MKLLKLWKRMKPNKAERKRNNINFFAYKK